MRLLFFIALSIIAVSAFSQGSLPLPYPYQNIGVPPGPPDFYYRRTVKSPYNNTPYSSLAQAKTTLKPAVRYTGMTFFVMSSTDTTEYWLRRDTTWAHLEKKLGSGSAGTSVIASDGLTFTGDSLKIGGEVKHDININNSDGRYPGFYLNALGNFGIAGYSGGFGYADSPTASNFFLSPDAINGFAINDGDASSDYLEGVTFFTGISSRINRFHIDSLGRWALGPTKDIGTSGQVFTSNGASGAPTWETPSGGGGGGTTIVSSGKIGDIYTEKFKTSLAAYTNAGTGTATITSSTLHISGGDSTVSNVLYRTSTISSFDYCYHKVHFASTSNATADGIGVGFTSRSVISQQQNVYATVNTSAGSERGRVIIRCLSSSGTQVKLATSATKLSYTNGDSLEVVIIYNSGSTEVHVTNLNVPANAPVYVSFTVPYTVVSPATGYVTVQSPAIYILGGAQTVTLDVFGTDYPKNPLVIRLGDSIGTGAFAGSYQGREASLTASQLLGDQIVFSSGGNTAQDIINGFDQVINAHPKYATINLGTNDIANSVTLGTPTTAGTFMFRLEAIKNLCIANNIIPVFLYITPSASLSNTTINTWNTAINTAYAGQYLVIDINTPLKDGGSSLPTKFDSGDGIHPSGLAHSLMSKTILDAVKSWQRSQRFDNYGTTKDIAIGFKINTQDAGFGAFPASTSLLGVGGISLLSDPAGSTSYGVHIPYFAGTGSTYRLAFSIKNTASSYGALDLMKGGGTINTDATFSTTAPLTSTSTGHFDGAFTVGTTGSFKIAPDVGSFGELPTGTFPLFEGSNSGGLAILPDQTGIAGNPVVAAYFDGVTYRSALEYANTASGFGTLKLMRSGGTVLVGPLAGLGTRLVTADASGNLSSTTTPAITLDNVFLKTSTQASGRNVLSSDNNSIVYFTNTSPVSMSIVTGLTLGFHCRLLQTGAAGSIVVSGSGTTVIGATSTTNIGDMLDIYYYKSSETYVVTLIPAPVVALRKAGSFSGAGTATTVFTVTFGNTQANTSYKVLVTPTSALSAALFYVTNKTTTTFDVTYLAGLTGTVTFDWLVEP